MNMSRDMSNYNISKACRNCINVKVGNPRDTFPHKKPYCGLTEIKLEYHEFYRHTCDEWSEKAQ
jgi:hypothetical protein